MEKKLEEINFLAKFLANDMMDCFDKENLKNVYRTKKQGDDFGYQFANACVDIAIKNIVQAHDKAVEVCIEKFGEIPEGPQLDLAVKTQKDRILKKTNLALGQCLLQLNDSEFGYGIETYKNKLTTSIPEFSQPSKDGRELTADTREKIAININSLDDCDREKRQVLINVISDFDKIDKEKKHKPS